MNSRTARLSSIMTFFYFSRVQIGGDVMAVVDPGFAVGESQSRGGDGGANS